MQRDYFEYQAKTEHKISVTLGHGVEGHSSDSNGLYSPVLSKQTFWRRRHKFLCVYKLNVCVYKTKYHCWKNWIQIGNWNFEIFGCQGTAMH